MKRCVICSEEREEVSLVQVVPGVWNSFFNFTHICATCQESEAYRKLVKQKKVISSG
jgi:hypothetical protein